uniref:Mos1 transposase HTH domain-containing protein n=1 Tax=Glossina austeni TaxID=7395 RepID=A0A1A9VPV1_GLOAU
MDSQKKHLLHCFKKDSGTKDTADGSGSVTTTFRTVRDCFKKFRAGNSDWKDEERSGCSATTRTDFIKSVVAENPRHGVPELVDATNAPNARRLANYCLGCLCLIYLDLHLHFLKAAFTIE